jgi:glycosyltransferase involved in cell wall biosynthesis
VYEAPAEVFKAARRPPNDMPMILAVTSDSLHKNVPRLIRALPEVKKRIAQPVQLVLVGSLREHSTKQSIGRQELLAVARAEGVADMVDIRGFVDEQELAELYQTASFLVFPTTYEGFGLPVVEALAAELPLVVSRAASLPEVGGDCVLYFDPMDSQDIADKISTALERPDLMSTLAKKGAEYVRRFDWHRTAAQTLAVYQRVASRA